MRDAVTLLTEGFLFVCRILVSSTRKPISYINLSKRFLQVSLKIMHAHINKAVIFGAAAR